MNAVDRPRRILVTRLRFLGDVVLSIPLLEHLREQHPGSRIEYLVDSRFAPVLRGLPMLDAVHELSPQAGLRETLRLVQRLRSPRIDWWIDLFTNPRSCALALLASPRRGVGSARGLRSRVYSERREKPPGNPTAIEHHLDKLVPLVGSCESRPPRLRVSDAERQECERMLGPMPPVAPILLNPGSTWPDKAWPADRWPRLAARIRGVCDAPLWMIQPPGEEERTEALAHEAGARCLPVLGLRPLLALLEAARLHVGNDGGVMHCAIALQTPTLALFGPTDPSIWFPYPGAGIYRVLRGEHGEMAEISVDEAAQVIEEMLQETPAP